jgi:formylglycine-generating enzyme required for sulfatase activity
MTRKMFVTYAVAAALVSLTVLTNSASATVIFDWATVGNAGNAADPLNSATVPGIGSVAYTYRIAKHEVTNAQYAEFLNAAAGSDPNGLYHTMMGVTVERGGITRFGSSGSFTYVPMANMGNKPVNYVSFFDAMRFTNWLHNGQGAGDTETGVYSITNGVSETRDPSASFFIPTENEWYKAAYHKPASQGGDSDDYFYYPTTSNAAPGQASANSVGDMKSTTIRVANYNNHALWNGFGGGNVTTVGSASPVSASFYGTFDQAGNVEEWNEAMIIFPSIRRGLRGGGWDHSAFALSSGHRGSITPEAEGKAIGFRVASPVPEPASVAVLALGVPALLRRRTH